MKNETQVEREIQDKGLVAPRLTPTLINNVIVGAAYYRFPGTTVTVCCLSLTNGFSVIGESASASAENFDAQIGMDIARANAREKIWALEGYLLKQKLHEDEQS
jgi:hypothetical protein